MSTLKPASTPSSKSSERPKTPSDIAVPAFVLNFPFSYTTDNPNNVWMEEYEEGAREVDFDRAMAQWMELCSFLSSEGLVYLLPTPPNCGLQDLVFAANHGIVLTHLPEPIFVASHFKSEPRRGEEMLAMQFLHQLGYHTAVPPVFFEGEAELKHLYDNVYVGGYGQRSDIEAYDWMESTFGMRIVKLEETDPFFYHVDCTIFPITRTETLVCTEMYTNEELHELEQVTTIIPVTVNDCMQGICNSVRLGGTVLNMSNLHALDRLSDDYKKERTKNDNLLDICAERALEVSFFDLSEFLKGGAVLSCLVLHLNRFSYQVDLL